MLISYYIIISSKKVYFKEYPQRKKLKNKTQKIRAKSLQNYFLIWLSNSSEKCQLAYYH